MNLIFKIAAGVVLAVIVLAVGCSALVSSSVSDTLNSGDAKAQRLIEARHWIELGMSRSEVETLAGPPEDKQHDVSRYAGMTSTSDYWYYGVLSENGWQLAFENNRLVSI